jgi:hypothetical protein
VKIVARDGNCKYFPEHFQRSFYHFLTFMNVDHAGRDSNLSASDGAGPEATTAVL